MVLSRTKKIAQAEEMFQKAIAVNPGTDIVYLEFADYYQQQHNYPRAEWVFKRLRETVRNTDNYTDTTRHNYQKLRDIVLRRGIKLVCMQYPRRSLKPLKEMLGDRGGIIFVDNEKIFQEALQKGKYEDYFGDRFAGDFGHCTLKGNRLLANNIVDVLLKEYFGK